MTQILGKAVFKSAGKTWSAFTTTEKILLAIGSIISIGTVLGLAKMIDVPRMPGFNGSLLAGPSPIISFLVTAIAIAICMIIGSMVAAFIEDEAGLFCAGIGLTAFAIRCGPVRPVYQFASGSSVLIAMAFECLLLGAVLVAGWWGLSQIFSRVRSRQLPAIAATAPNELTDATLSQKLMTTGIQIIVMALLEQVLIQSDVKAQALAGVGVAAFVGSLAAYMVYPLPSGVWFWVGPVILGVLGYLLAFMSADGLAVGEMHGWAAAMARPVPLDYAGIGTAGALVGYWTSRRWAQPEESSETVSQLAA